jgi:hypothetical protein
MIFGAHQRQSQQQNTAALGPIDNTLTLIIGSSFFFCFDSVQQCVKITIFQT